MKTLYLSIVPVLLFSLIACTNSNTNTNDPTTSEDLAPQEKTENTAKKESTFTYGIDISKFQGDEMAFMDKSKDSLSFIICRSTEGITYTDPKFQTNWTSIKEKGFIRGAYHFYRSDDDPNKQADNFLQTVGTFEANDFPPIIDFEEKSIVDGSDKVKVIDDLLSFIEIIETRTGRLPMIYTDINIGNSYLNSEKFAKYPLWIADYSSKTEPRMPGAWKNNKWILWQKTYQYMYETFQDDFDQYNGDLSTLKAFIVSTKQ